MDLFLTKKNDCDSVISCSVTLMRNVNDYPFSYKADRKSAEEINEKLSRLFSGRLSQADLSFPLKCAFLCEKGYMSKGALFLLENPEKDLSISVFGENHIEIRIFSDKPDLYLLFEKALKIDSEIDSSFTYSFNEKTGYITSSPYDLGCAMRLSADLFLPGVEESSSFSEINDYLSKKGMSVKTKAGYVYTLESGKTLGFSEEEVISNFDNAIKKICDFEKSERERLYSDDLLSLSDRIMKSFGKAKYSKILSFPEFVKIYSDLRLGIFLGIGGYNIDSKALDSLYYSSYKSYLSFSCEKEPNKDISRASNLKDLVKDA